MAKIEIEVSEKNECTRAPFWVIVEPIHRSTNGDDDDSEDCMISATSVASKFHGLFFSREEAEEYLKLTHYNFSSGAIVYCKSGHHGKQYDKACDESRIGH